METLKQYRHALRHLQHLVNINNSDIRAAKLVKLLPASEIKSKFISYARKEFELNKRKLQNDKLTDEQIATKLKQFKRIVKNLGQAVADASHDTNKRRYIEQSSCIQLLKIFEKEWGNPEYKTFIIDSFSQLNNSKSAITTKKS